MEPKLVKIFNEDQENYFKFEIKDQNSFEDERILSQFLGELGFGNIEFKGDNPGIKKKYKERIGLHKFVENKQVKIHIIFAEKYLHLVIKCSLKNRKVIIKLIKKYFNFFT